MKRLKALKTGVLLLVALSAAAGPAFLAGSPQAVAAQAGPASPVKPAKPDVPAKADTSAKADTPAKADAPAKAASPKPAKPAKSKPKPKSKAAKPKTKAKPKARAQSNAMAQSKAMAGTKVSTPPSGQFLLCRQDSTVRVHGQGRTYLVNNNNFLGWKECLSGSAHAPAFRVAVSKAAPTADSDSYPDIYTGCSWGRCSPGTALPARVSSLGNPVTTWQTTEIAPGAWAAAYDLWFDPRPLRTGQASTEMMIWLNVQGLYSAAGMGWPVVRIDGALWYVLTWITGNGHQQWRYVQFRKYTPRWGVTGLSLKPFYQYMERQGWITPSWYALNIEAGFEIWSGGAGLATTKFSAT